MANVLCSLDPKTGQFKEYPLKTAHSGPHGLVEDKVGNIWYTGNTGQLVGKLDPKTGAVTEYKMPDPNAKDPHSLVFDQNEILWFTLQNSNMIGRLDPKSGDIKLVTAPTAKSRPYGIQVNSKGVPFTVLFGTNKVASIDPKTEPYGISAIKDVIWYSESGTTPNTVVRFDPKTEKFQTWVIPGGGNIVRNTDVTRDGNFVLANSLVNAVTLVEIDK